jgi:hypothetical protein
MTMSARQRNSYVSRNMLRDWTIPALYICSINIPNRKAAI